MLNPQVCKFYNYVIYLVLLQEQTKCDFDSVCAIETKDNISEEDKADDGGDNDNDNGDDNGDDDTDEEDDECDDDDDRKW